MNQQNAKDWDRLGLVGGALVLFGVAVALRVHTLNASLWIDEVLTYRRAAESFWVSLRTSDTSLTTLLCHGVLQVSRGEAALRLPSLVAGLLAVGLVMILARSIAGSTAGWLAGFFVAVSPYHIGLSQDARYYAVFVLLGLAAMWGLRTAIAQNKPVGWVVFVVAAALGGITHLFFWPYLAAISFGAIIVAFIRGEKRMRQIGMVILCLALATLPLLGIMACRGKNPLRLASLVQSETTSLQPSDSDSAPAQQEQPPTPSSPHYRLTLRQFAGFLATYFPAQSAVVGTLLIALGLVGFVALWRLCPVYGVMFTAVLLLEPIPFFFLPVSHWFNPQYFCMHFALATLLIAIGAAVVCQFLAKKLSQLAQRAPRAASHIPLRAITGVLVILSLATVTAALNPALGRYYAERPAYDWKSLSRYMAPYITPGDTVIYAVLPDKPSAGSLYWEAVMKTPLAFYLRQPDRRGSAIVQHMTHEGHMTTDSFLPQIKGDNGNIWIVIRDENRFPSTVLAELDKLTGPPRTFGGLTLRVYGRPTENFIYGGACQDLPLPEALTQPAPKRDVPFGMADLPPVSYVTGAEAFAGTKSLRVFNWQPLNPDAGLDFYVVDPATKRGLTYAPDDVYTVSGWFKQENLRRGSEPLLVGTMMLSGTAHDQTTGNDSLVMVPLYAFQGTQDWHFLSLQVQPGQLLPTNVRDVTLKFNFAGGAGTLWMDNLQLERGPLATPFTDGVRPALSTAFARLAAAS